MGFARLIQGPSPEILDRINQKSDNSSNDGVERAKLISLPTPETIKAARQWEEAQIERLRRKGQASPDEQVLFSDAQKVKGVTEKFNNLFAIAEENSIDDSSVVLESAGEVLDSGAISKGMSGFIKDVSVDVIVPGEAEKTEFENFSNGKETTRNMDFGRYDFLNAQPDILFALPVARGNQSINNIDSYSKPVQEKINKLSLGENNNGGQIISKYQAFFFRKFVVLESCFSGNAAFVLDYSASKELVDKFYRREISLDDIKEVSREFAEACADYTKEMFGDIGEKIEHKGKDGAMVKWLEKLYHSMNKRDDYGFLRLKGICDMTLPEKIQ